jgi:hypothetical protein
MAISSLFSGRSSLEFNGIFCSIPMLLSRVYFVHMSSRERKGEYQYSILHKTKAQVTKQIQVRQTSMLTHEIQVRQTSMLTHELQPEQQQRFKPIIPTHERVHAYQANA